MELFKEEDFKDPLPLSFDVFLKHFQWSSHHDFAIFVAKMRKNCWVSAE